VRKLAIPIGARLVVYSVSMKVTFIATIFNEENSISAFLDSLFSQTVLPYEIIIVDAGSTDNTVRIAENKIQEFKKFNKKILIKIFAKKGNRSMGRNSAIEEATGDIIACSDAGCTLHKDWLKLIAHPLNTSNVDVVSGFYKPIANTIFEKCLATYTCVMSDNVNPVTFLPSSRSVAFKKNAWKRVGGYPEELDTCEDLIFAKKLQKAGYKFIFEKNAIVYWPQRKNLTKAFIQFFTYAQGDGQALYFRPQTPFLFGRYIAASAVLLLVVITQNAFLMFGLYILFFLYLVWSIVKNFKYIKKIKALFILPALQLTADIAVLSGTLFGIIKRFIGKK
jgi:glycosyltransferase involved in cell wall biosynthesis